MVKYLKGAIFHADSEEKSALHIILFSNITVCMCIVDIIIIDTIKSIGIIGDDTRIMGENFGKFQKE